MKITWSDQQNLIQEITGLTDAASLTVFKRDINTGASLFLAVLGREYNRKSRVTDLKADQQYYQLPEDAHKLKEVIASWSSTYKNPLEQVPDEHSWRRLNMVSVTGQPTHYFIRGYDEIGLYPIPSANVTNGLELVFSPRHVQLTEDDYSTGTVTVTDGSQTVTGSGTTFTAKMVGQWFQVTDGTDENWYRVSAYTSATVLTIENYYQGTSGSGKTYRIGQVMDLPEEYLEGPVDYAAYRFYLKRGSKEKNDFKALFEESLQRAKQEYGQMTDNQVINAEPEYRIYNPFRGDPPASISA